MDCPRFGSGSTEKVNLTKIFILLEGIKANILEIEKTNWIACLGEISEIIAK